MGYQEIQTVIPSLRIAGRGTVCEPTATRAENYLLVGEMGEYTVLTTISAQFAIGHAGVLMPLHNARASWLATVSSSWGQGRAAVARGFGDRQACQLSRFTVLRG